MTDKLVSIIIPMYNSEDTILETLNSIKGQTYKNFEALIVDDSSSDKSVEIVKRYIENDKRFHLFEFSQNQGAAMARNFALTKAKGSTIAFLDADDLWLPEKLEHQLQFMETNHYDFTYTSYQLFNQLEQKMTSIRKAPPSITLNRQLMGNNIGCLTVMYNAQAVGLIQIPALEKRNDAALWQVALQRIDKGYHLDEVLATYRVKSGSLSQSTSKISLLKHHYRLYRINMKYSKVKSAVFVVFNIINYMILRLFYTDRKRD